MSDSESDYSEPKTPRRRCRPRLKTLPDGGIMCITCGMQFSTKGSAYKHTRFCKAKGKKPAQLQEKVEITTECKWCGIKFTNRGNLATHAYYVHGDASYKRKPAEKPHNICQGCSKSFPSETRLRNHIRNNHFNLKATVPHFEFTTVNQVWFEKVYKTNKVMEMRRTSHNTLVMRILEDGTKVETVKRKVIDVSNLYPVYQPDVRINCTHCNKNMLKRDYKKHVDETHLNLRKHSCNLCNRSFKRAYQYLQHHCDKKFRVKGVVHMKDAEFRVATIESLNV